MIKTFEINITDKNKIIVPISSVLYVGENGPYTHYVVLKDGKDYSISSKTYIELLQALDKPYISVKDYADPIP